MFKRQINFEDFNILEKEITMPSTAQHRKYEALRAIIIDRENIEIVANKFEHMTHTQEKRFNGDFNKRLFMLN